ncbi:hypothetical protein [Rhodoblastus sp.]|uniref:hypothetical protein n=1 Tax=Rhodoblastus sp. TaxID=1962975 RepID=UPI003F98AFDC
MRQWRGVTRHCARRRREARECSVILEFDDYETAEAYFNSADGSYRPGAADFDLPLVEGV